MHLPWHNFHFIGIGGIGMSGLASLLLEAGYKVSGSDLNTNALIERLKAKGGRVYLGHRAEQVNGAEVVVYSSAVKPDNPELEIARKKRLPTLSRGELLALLMEEKKGIAIAGTHGKTTTSAMIACILEKAGLSPTVIVGGCINNTGINAWWGKGEFLVAEADESDGSFLKLHPYIAVVTNIEADHLDYYQNLEAVVNAFSQFLRNLRPEGYAIIWGDDERLKHLAKGVNIPHLSFGLTPGQDIEARHLSLNGAGNQFELYVQGEKVCVVNFPFPGQHNVLNALAAIAVATALNIDLEIATAALKEFKGVGRRLEIKGEQNGVLVIDDYGHHPTEIKATLRAIKQRWPKRRLITVFQPHRYSRTLALYPEFLDAFAETDELILTEIYAACEKPIAGVSGKWLAEGVAKRRSVYYCPDFETVLKKLNSMVKEGDIVLTIGAGNIWQLGENFLEQRLCRI